MAEQEDWSSDANGAIEITICQPGDQCPQSLSSFHPVFTYPIFGEEERIFGYRGLNISLRFAAHDLYPGVEVNYDAKFKQVGETAATDVLKILQDFLPAYAFDEPKKFNIRVQEDASGQSFRPPGKLTESYGSKGRNFEIWCGEMTDPAVRLLLERMQIFVSFFIEGGTPLALDDQEWTLARWRVFFVYEKLASPPTPNGSCYSIVGYSTSYRFLTYIHTATPSKPLHSLAFLHEPPISVASIPSRARISQFLILPSHQAHSHGTHLYNNMIATFLDDPACIEITVEDPNETFDDLRDNCDYARLLTNGTFSQIKLQTAIDPKSNFKPKGAKVPTNKLLNKSLLKTLRATNKIAPRQFARLVELYLLSQIPAHSRQAGPTRLTQRGNSKDDGDRAYYYWRMLVKQRIYKKNRDALAELGAGERIDKVEETLSDQTSDYERLLKGMGERAAHVLEAEARMEREEDLKAGSGRAKRRIVDEEEDEEEDEEDEEDEEEEEEGEKEERRAEEAGRSDGVREDRQNNARGAENGVEEERGRKRRRVDYE